LLGGASFEIRPSRDAPEAKHMEVDEPSHTSSFSPLVADSQIEGSSTRWNHHPTLILERKPPEEKMGDRKNCEAMPGPFEEAKAAERAREPLETMKQKGD